MHEEANFSYFQLRGQDLPLFCMRYLVNPWTLHAPNYETKPPLRCIAAPCEVLGTKESVGEGAL